MPAGLAELELIASSLPLTVKQALIGARWYIFETFDNPAGQNSGYSREGHVAIILVADDIIKANCTTADRTGPDGICFVPANVKRSSATSASGTLGASTNLKCEGCNTHSTGCRMSC